MGPLNETRYFQELAEKFESPIRTGLYCYHFYYHCTYGTGLVLLSVRRVLISIQDH
jgi:hypothetical protein